MRELDVTQSHLDAGCNLLNDPPPFPDHTSYTAATVQFSLAELSSRPPLHLIQALPTFSDVLRMDASATSDKPTTET